MRLTDDMIEKDLRMKYEDPDCVWDYMRHPWTPASVALKLRDGIITAVDLMLLWTFDHMMDHPYGCSVSDEFLAKSLKTVNRNHVSRRIAHLHKLGLIIVIYPSGKRYIETNWQRGYSSKSFPNEEYADCYRKAHEEMFPNLHGVSK